MYMSVYLPGILMLKLLLVVSRLLLNANIMLRSGWSKEEAASADTPPTPSAIAASQQQQHQQQPSSSSHPASHAPDQRQAVVSAPSFELMFQPSSFHAYLT